ncbi:MAG: hypothetical protein Q7S07_03030, partial [Candidatus Omnitrophota bacterium]|nr:hypothetical protein [Candidatus Omnitrophota bacterium]
MAETKNLYDNKKAIRDAVRRYHGEITGEEIKKSHLYGPAFDMEAKIKKGEDSSGRIKEAKETLILLIRESMTDARVTYWALFMREFGLTKEELFELFTGAKNLGKQGIEALTGTGVRPEGRRVSVKRDMIRQRELGGESRWLKYLTEDCELRGANDKERAANKAHIDHIFLIESNLAKLVELSDFVGDDPVTIGNRSAAAMDIEELGEKSFWCKKYVDKDGVKKAKEPVSQVVPQQATTVQAVIAAVPAAPVIASPAKQGEAISKEEAARQRLVYQHANAFLYGNVGIDPKSGWPFDHFNLGADGKTITSVGIYTSPTNIGLTLTEWMHIAKGNIQQTGSAQATNQKVALSKIEKALKSLADLPDDQKWNGLFYWYGLASGIKKSDDNIISQPDNANLAISLVALMGAFSDDLKVIKDPNDPIYKMKKNIVDYADSIFDGMKWEFLTDRTTNIMYLAWDTGKNQPLKDEKGKPYLVDNINDEWRIGVILAITKRGLPHELWNNLGRVKAAADKGFMTGHGGMFQAFLPSIFLDEAAWSPKGFGESQRIFLKDQIELAKKLGIPALFSAASNPDGDPDKTNSYDEFGHPEYAIKKDEEFKAGPDGAPDTTPFTGYGTSHAIAFAFLIDPAASMNLFAELEKIPGVKNEYGYKDAIGPLRPDGTRMMSNRVFSLDHGILILALQGKKTSEYVTRYFESIGKLDEIKGLYANVDLAFAPVIARSPIGATKQSQTPATSNPGDEFRIRDTLAAQKIKPLEGEDGQGDCMSIAQDLDENRANSIWFRWFNLDGSVKGADEAKKQANRDKVSGVFIAAENINKEAGKYGIDALKGTGKIPTGRRMAMAAVLVVYGENSDWARYANTNGSIRGNNEKVKKINAGYLNKIFDMAEHLTDKDAALLMQINPDEITEGHKTAMAMGLVELLIDKLKGDENLLKEIIAYRIETAKCIGPIPTVGTVYKMELFLHKAVNIILIEARMNKPLTPGEKATVEQKAEQEFPAIYRYSYISAVADDLHISVTKIDKSVNYLKIVKNYLDRKNIGQNFKGPLFEASAESRARLKMSALVRTMRKAKIAQAVIDEFVNKYEWQYKAAYLNEKDKGKWRLDGLTTILVRRLIESGVKEDKIMSALPRLLQQYLNFHDQDKEAGGLEKLVAEAEHIPAPPSNIANVPAGYEDSLRNDIKVFVDAFNNPDILLREKAGRGLVENVIKHPDRAISIIGILESQARPDVAGFAEIVMTIKDIGLIDLPAEEKALVEAYPITKDKGKKTESTEMYKFHKADEILEKSIEALLVIFQREDNKTAIQTKDAILMLSSGLVNMRDYESKIEVLRQCMSSDFDNLKDYRPKRIYLFDIFSRTGDINKQLLGMNLATDIIHRAPIFDENHTGSIFFAGPFNSLKELLVSNNAYVRQEAERLLMDSLRRQILVTANKGWEDRETYLITQEHMKFLKSAIENAGKKKDYETAYTLISIIEQIAELSALSGTKTINNFGETVSEDQASDLIKFFEDLIVNPAVTNNKVKARSAETVLMIISNRMMRQILGSRDIKEFMDRREWGRLEPHIKPNIEYLAGIYSPDNSNFIMRNGVYEAFARLLMSQYSSEENVRKPIIGLLVKLMSQGDNMSMKLLRELASKQRIANQYTDMWIRAKSVPIIGHVVAVPVGKKEGVEVKIRRQLWDETNRMLEQSPANENLLALRNELIKQGDVLENIAGKAWQTLKAEREAVKAALAALPKDEALKRRLDLAETALKALIPAQHTRIDDKAAFSVSDKLFTEIIVYLTNTGAKDDMEFAGKLISIRKSVTGEYIDEARLGIKPKEPVVIRKPAQGVSTARLPAISFFEVTDDLKGRCEQYRLKAQKLLPKNTGAVGFVRYMIRGRVEIIAIVSELAGEALSRSNNHDSDIISRAILSIIENLPGRDAVFVLKKALGIDAKNIITKDGLIEPLLLGDLLSNKLKPGKLDYAKATTNDERELTNIKNLLHRSPKEIAENAKRNSLSYVKTYLARPTENRDLYCAYIAIDSLGRFTFDPETEHSEMAGRDKLLIAIMSDTRDAIVRSKAVVTIGRLAVSGSISREFLPEIKSALLKIYNNKEEDGYKIDEAALLKLSAAQALLRIVSGIGETPAAGDIDDIKKNAPALLSFVKTRLRGVDGLNAKWDEMLKNGFPKESPEQQKIVLAEKFLTAYEELYAELIGTKADIVIADGMAGGDDVAAVIIEYGSNLKPFGLIETKPSLQSIGAMARAGSFIPKSIQDDLIGRLLLIAKTGSYDTKTASLEALAGVLSNESVSAGKVEFTIRELLKMFDNRDEAYVRPEIFKAISTAVNVREENLRLDVIREIYARAKRINTATSISVRLREQAMLMIKQIGRFADEVNKPGEIGLTPEQKELKQRDEEGRLKVLEESRKALQEELKKKEQALESARKDLQKDMKSASAVIYTATGPIRELTVPEKALFDVLESRTEQGLTGMRMLMADGAVFPVNAKRFLGNKWQGPNETKPADIAGDVFYRCVKIKKMESSGAKKEIVDAEKKQLAVNINSIAALVLQIGYNGILPEYISLDDGVASAKIKDDGSVDHSSLDMGFLTMALGMVESAFGKDKEMAAVVAQALRINAAVDYNQFLDSKGLLKHGFTVAQDGKVSDFTYGLFTLSYGDMNSEARAVVLYLVTTGRLARSAFDNMSIGVVEREGQQMFGCWKMGAWPEYMPNIFFDEMAIAQETFGRSHLNHLFASMKIAARKRYKVFGWGPCTSPDGEYGNFYGLDRNNVASPLAAALLTTTGHAAAWNNLANMILLAGPQGYTEWGLQNSVDSESGAGILVRDVRELDMAFIYLALNKETVQAILKQSPWYPEAVSLIAGVNRAKSPIREKVESISPGAERSPTVIAKESEISGLKTSIGADKQTAEDRKQSADELTAKVKEFKESSGMREKYEPSSAYEAAKGVIFNSQINPNDLVASIFALDTMGLERRIPSEDIGTIVARFIDLVEKTEDRAVYEAICRTLGNWTVGGYNRDERLNTRLTNVLLLRLIENTSLNREMVELTAETLVKVNISEYSHAAVSGGKLVIGFGSIITDRNIDVTIRSVIIDCATDFIEGKKDIQREGFVRIADVNGLLRALERAARSDISALIRGKAIVAISKLYSIRMDLAAPEGIKFLMQL